MVLSVGKVCRVLGLVGYLGVLGLWGIDREFRGAAAFLYSTEELLHLLFKPVRIALIACNDA